MTIPHMLKQSPRRPLVAASILSADFARLGEESRAALQAGADLLHLDVMDGHFVPNLTMGPALCRSLRDHLPEVTLDVHLMVERPGDYVQPFADAGASHLTFHIEAVPEPAALAEEIRERGMTAGLALNPPTELSRIEPYLEQFDLILVMSVNPGFSGQSFMAEVLAKTRAIRPRLRKDQRLEMDGGVSPATAEACVEAGADVLVAASAIYGAADYGRAIAGLRGEATPSAAARR